MTANVPTKQMNISDSKPMNYSKDLSSMVWDTVTDEHNIETKKDERRKINELNNDMKCYIEDQIVKVVKNETDKIYQSCEMAIEKKFEKKINELHTNQKAQNLIIDR